MKFSDIIDQASALLQRKGRLTYRTLKREFELDDDGLEDLKFELIEGQCVAVDEDGKVLVWNGDPTSTTGISPTAEQTPSASSARTPTSTGERRQLTVMFCDLVGSTALSEQLDPEELQTVVRTYQEVSAQVIERYEGYIAQYLGDGLLVYFGYPTAHEDDAARAIRAGLGIVAALEQARARFPQPVQVRIGIHTGPVVVGQMGGGGRHEQLALGETPNIAARVQGQAEPDTVVISTATQRMVTGLFETADRGRHELKGISTPQTLYRVMAESPAQSRFEAAVRSGLTPLVGRESELSILTERWTQAQAGNGQVVLVSGEPGIGKSRLVEEFKAQVSDTDARQIEFRCSPYHQNSALYPITEHLQRLLRFAPNDIPEAKLDKLQQRLSHYRFPQADTVPLMAALLSLPHPEGVPPLTVSPQKQKEQTQAALVAWLIEESERTPIYNTWEDLHWADPSTLEVLDLVLSQVPTTRLLVLLTFRPEFVPPWGTHSYLSHVALSRLGRSQVNAMVERVTGGKALPEEVVRQIVTKTDGVPIFVEELTKMVVESDFVRRVNNHYELTGPLPPLAIPSTLQDSLMARLDRLAAAREIAQLGATLGREFTYSLLRAVSPGGEEALQQGLKQLVETELVYQRGLPPQARYLFKHALIRDTAYASLLKSRRQQLHQQVAQVLEQQFPETVETQPELVAHHYTEAGLSAQAVPLWQQAGQRAIQRSANVEAISHLTHGLDVLTSLPGTQERSQQELTLQATLGTALMATKGWAAPEVKTAYTRAQELCEQMADTPQLFPVWHGLWTFHYIRAEHTTGLELGERLLRLARQFDDPALLLEAHLALAHSLLLTGEIARAREHWAGGVALYDREQHHALTFIYFGFDPGVTSLGGLGLALHNLGYPDQGMQRMTDALRLARELAHPFTLAQALLNAGVHHIYRRAVLRAEETLTEMVALSTEQGFPLYVALGTMLRGWVIVAQGHGEEGRKQIREGWDSYRATGAELLLPIGLAGLAQAHASVGQVAEGLAELATARERMGMTGERQYAAEVSRLTGELLLQQSYTSRSEAEASFQKAIKIPQHQKAKSWELRAATSLARLWQGQGKRAEARELLAPIYTWFTEGLDTADLKDAKTLLAELSERP